MSQPVNARHPHAYAGATMVEYAILLGLVGMVSIVGLKAMGVSTHNLLANTGTKLENDSTLNLLSPVSKAGQVSQSGKNSEPYTLVTDPATGKLTFQVTDGGTAVATNVTSIDGKTMNTLGSNMLAKRLDQLAQTETDPALKDYYTQMAQLSFYLGGAEGVLDNVQGLDLPSSKYTNADALHDVITMSGQLKKLMDSPPPNMDQATFNEVMPLAADVFNIANQYQTSLKDFIGPDKVSTKQFNGQEQVQEANTFLGKVFDFLLGPETVTIPPNSSGNGTPGSALTSNNSVPGAVQTAYTSYSSLVDYNQLKNTATQVLAASNVQSIPVASTLTDAKSIDNTASSSP